MTRRQKQFLSALKLEQGKKRREKVRDGQQFESMVFINCGQKWENGIKEPEPLGMI